MTSQTIASTILCIEDERDLLRDISEELEEAGYQVLAASNGRRALALLKNHHPDLILCDISMPGMNGFELLEALQSRGLEYADTPFVFLTALSDPQQVVRGKQLGADDYLVKPIDYDLLLATVAARLRQVERLQACHRVDSQSLIARYRLTQAEARVALALTDGMPLDEIAATYGCARSTVVSHLRHIFDKTDTNRQAELVALLLKP